MGSGIIYYEIEKCEEYEDSDERADSDLAIVKTRRYHFDGEPFIHPLHSIRFDPDRPYELLLSLFFPLDVETLRRRKIHLLKNLTHQDEQVRYRNTLPLVPWFDSDLHRRLLRWFPLLKDKMGQDNSRVGSSFRHPKVRCAKVMMLRVRKQVKMSLRG
ncbi:hypothetical protein PIB30_064043 [Stylosanthes scabra]|uniref:Uncharacterized protein n=1 Tax=Stylosanthes scabra TaxID=79078 RepID=A0ABU6WJU2_9FABA|nr:hypothetical protein [Stylosanthes scabra]